MSYYDQVQQACDAVRARVADVPRIGVVLGSGLGALASELADAVSIPVPSHAIERATVDRIIFLQRSLPPLIGAPVVGFELFSAIPHEIRAVSNEGVMLIFKRDDDFGNVLRVLKKVWEHEIGTTHKKIDYIDLRFGNKVFYKMR